MKHRTRTHKGFVRVTAIAQISFFLFAGISCDPSAETPRTARIRQAVIGRDGANTITTAGTIVNAYGVLAADATVGASTLTVTSLASLATAGQAALAQGDLILVIQMAGATMNTTDTADYGAVTDLNGSGRYEFIGVNGVAGNTITLACGLKNSYSVAGKTQVIRVPQYTTLTIEDGASIVPLPWDGTRGGVVAVHAENTVTLNGQIDVTGRGFRGGATDNTTTDADSSVLIYRSSSGDSGGEKGESIAGDATLYNTLNGRFGRGAPANGGGGGNAHNSGGGGGANARLGLSWTGQGVMLSTVTGAAAWLLEPDLGGTLANSQGGGRGGYSYSNSDQNALTVAPGNDAWLGNYRRQVGGLGGRPLDNNPSSRLFFGGGGGAGDGNNHSAGAGGNGGGIVFVIAGTVNGTGQILAKGQAGGDATLSPSDGAGGGGGGGSVVVNASSILGISIDASGGNGGNQTNSNAAEVEGPGGGGGGGYIAVAGGSPTRVAAGGLGGTTNRPAMAEFPNNGATAGNSGQIDGNAASLVYCGGFVEPDTFISTQTAAVTNLTTATFTFTSTVTPVTYECKIDQGTYQPCPATTIIAALKEGTHSVYARAVNQGSTVDSTPAVFTWTIETTAPDTILAQKPPIMTTLPQGSFTFESNDPEATFECRLGTAAFADCPPNYTTPLLLPGSHTLEVRAKDKAGNVDPSPVTFTWTVQAAVDAGVMDSSLPDAPIADTPSLDLADAVSENEVQATNDLPEVAVDLSSQDVATILADANTERPLNPDTRPADATRISDTRPDTLKQVDTQAITDAGVSSDVPTLPGPDAAQPEEKVVALGGGFCSLAATPNQSVWPFLMLFGVWVSLRIGRRRR